MMIVPTYVAPSEIEGVGIFATSAIKAGTAIWELSDDLDLLLTREQLARSPNCSGASSSAMAIPI